MCDDDDRLIHTKRSRIQIEMEKTDKSGHTLLDKYLCLNEVFVAEKDVSSASRYRLNKDSDTNLGVFKSSGLIVSTGTGSTGWLYSSR